ncbi:MAG TPA: hypothetical protein VFG13_05330 [Blastococcus sp.]|nr:hypothetical protein [Blastococcus sp.]
MSPLRWDVLLVGFVLAVPVVALGLRGDLSPEETMTRVLWCLVAGWAVVAVLRLAAAPPPPTVTKKTAVPPHLSSDTAEPSEPSPSF